MAVNKLSHDEIEDLRYFWRLGAKPLDLARIYGISPEAAYAHTTYKQKRDIYRKKYYSSEMPHVKEQRKRWQQSEKGSLSRYGYFIKTRYGLTLADKQKMFDSQNGACAICGELLKSMRLAHIDHNHTTGKVRALLCAGCNTRLAVLENKEFCVKASLYLEVYSDHA